MIYWLKLYVTAAMLLFSAVNSLFAQVPERHLKDTFTTEPYKERIVKTYLNGQYIPRSLTDALTELDKRMEPDAQEAFKNLSEEDAGKKAFFSFGRWIMLKWGMEDGSRLTEYFRQRNVGVVEDMTRIIMIAYHRKINGKPIEEEQLIQFYRKIRLEEYQAKKKRLLENSRKLEK